MTKFISVLYGSETGTAEDVAFKVHREFVQLRQNRLEEASALTATPVPDSRDAISDEVAICALDDIIQEVTDSGLVDATSDDGRLFPQLRRAIFVVSTTGDGEPPANMRRFWRILLQKRLRTDSLSHLEFSVFGLGDSSYEKYNAAARRLRQRLLQLGAAEIAPIGLGDDQARYGYLQAFDIWMNSLMGVFIHRGDVFCRRVVAEAPSNPMYHVHVSHHDARNDLSTPASHRLVFSKPPDCYGTNSGVCLKSNATDYLAAGSCSCAPFEMKVIENKRLTADSWNQVVCHITLEVINGNPSEFRYLPGDIAVIHPENSEEFVTRSLGLLELKRSDVVTITVLPRTLRRKSRIHETLCCTADDLCRYYLDWGGRPQRSFFEGLWMHASSCPARDFSPEESQLLEKLLELSSSHGTDLYFDYCIRSKRGYLDVMSDFMPIVRRVPLCRLLELVPLLQPRPYSIASAPEECPNKVKIAYVHHIS
jgi:sulfite reductase alpha subunit-like flavoprotein